MTICEKPVRYALGNYTGLPLHSVIVLELRLSLLRLLQFYSIIKSLLPTKLYKGVAGVLSRVEVIGLRVSNYSAQTPRTLHSTSRSASKWAILFFSIFLRWDSITKTFSSENSATAKTTHPNRTEEKVHRMKTIDIDYFDGRFATNNYNYILL